MCGLRHKSLKSGEPMFVDVLERARSQILVECFHAPQSLPICVTRPRCAARGGKLPCCPSCGSIVLRIIFFSSAAERARRAFPSDSSLTRASCHSDCSVASMLLSGSFCGCFITLHASLSHCSGSSFTPVECVTVLHFFVSAILTGAGFPFAQPLVSR